MNSGDGRRQRANEWASRLWGAATTASEWATTTSQHLGGSLANGLNAAGTVASDAYAATFRWGDTSEFSEWLTNHLSVTLDSNAEAVTKTMDAIFNAKHICGNWHRLYDGAHTIAGSWEAAVESLPKSDTLERLDAWAKSYWNDLITPRGMPIITLNSSNQHGEYLKYLDSFNFAELLSGPLTGISIYCNWDNPAKLVASAIATDCSAFAYANVVAPLVSLIAFGRTYYLLTHSEHADLQALIEPTLRSLTLSGTILLVTVIPGGFLVHLSCGIVLKLAHSYVFDEVSENKEAILAALKNLLETLPQVIHQQRS
jgi:hypothetical protein